MTRLALTIATTCLLLSACSGSATPIEEDTAAVSPFCSDGKAMPGGWRSAGVSEEAKVALDFVVERMNSAANVQEILAVKTQVVAGLNYAIDFQLDNGEIWNTRVYQDLKGNFEMTKPAKRGSMSDGCPQ